MPIDPLIARGAQVTDPGNTLAQIAALRQRDMALAQDQQQQAMVRQKFERDVANSDKADQLWDEGMADLDSGDPVRLEQGKVKILRADPQAGAVLLKAKKLDGSNDGIGNYNPGDYTSESWGKFHASGYKDPTVLVRAYAPPAPFLINSPGMGVALGSRGGVGNAPAGSVIRQFTTPEEEAAARATAAGAEAGAKTTATAGAEAQANLPGVEYKADQIISTIEKFRDHPGTPQIYGGWSLVPIVPGTDRAGAASYLDQIGGQAFLQAFESLKGGGQITEIEGNKATIALTRLNKRGISFEEAKEAMDEFVTQARKGVALARRRAGQTAPVRPGQTAPGAAAPPAAGTSKTVNWDDM
jgi:hypothetical protein